ncbi:MAG: toll/interleukin-1 receptor domain-containing protein, partial [Alistipes sp.]|nr:toll/interleukin-1 receptor domain-containing protein [Alistipes sp.]
MTDNNDNTYVFFSHSHLDFDKVSRLRNILEAEGFKPLMFFLKAFENPKYEHLLKPILKEEIDQRQRFILCRSENTKESEWVQFEEEYIKSKRRAYEIIDLD